MATITFPSLTRFLLFFLKKIKHTEMFATLRANPSVISVARRSFSKSIPPTAVVSQHNYEYSPMIYSKTLPVVDFFAQAKSKPSYKLNHGAAGFAKRRPLKTNVTRHSRMVSQVGEDAYFRREDAIGVADGIGGWSDTEGKALVEKIF
jgi:hypothetical protein